MPSFDLDNPQYTGKSFDFTSEDILPAGFCFSQDGLHLYMVGNQNSSVYRYSLSTPFSIDTITYTGESFVFVDSVISGLQPENSNASCVRVSSGGDKVYVSVTGGRIYKYDLATPHSLQSVARDTTSQYLDQYGSMRLRHGTGAYTVYPEYGKFGGFFISPDGAHLLAVGMWGSSPSPYPYALAHFSCPNSDGVAVDSGDYYDGVGRVRPIEPAVGGSQNATMNPTKISSVFLDSSGKVAAVASDNGVHTVKLRVPYYFDDTIETGTSASATIDNPYVEHYNNADIQSLSPQVSDIQDIYLSGAGTFMILLDVSGSLFEFRITSIEDDFDVTKSGLSLYEVSSFIESALMSAGIVDYTYPDGIDFSPDGLKAILGYYAPFSIRFAQLTLTSPFDLTTISQADVSFPLPIAGNNFKWGHDGTYLLAMSNNSRRMYHLSTPYEVTSVTAYTDLTGYIGFAQYDTDWSYINQAGTKLAVASNFNNAAILVANDGTVGYDLLTFSDAPSGTYSTTSFNDLFPKDSPVDNLGGIYFAHENAYKSWFVVVNRALGTLYQFSFNQSISPAKLIIEDKSISFRNAVVPAGSTGYVFRMPANRVGNTVYMFTEDKRLAALSVPVPAASAYSAVEVSPGIVDFGTVTGDRTKNVTLINHSQSQNTVTAINGNLTNIQLSNLSVGTIIPPGGEITVGITLLTDNLSSGDISFSISFDNSQSLTTISVKYNKVVAWPIEPDWSSGVQVTMQWATSVTVSKTGVEKRRKLREGAKLSCSVKHFLSKESAKALSDISMRLSNRLIALPEWWYRVQITSPALAGSTVVALDNSRGLISAGDMVCLAVSGIVKQVTYVYSASPTSIVLSDPLNSDINQGWDILPSVLSRLSSKTTTKTLSREVSSVGASFVSSEKYTRNLTGYSPVQSFSSENGKSLPVFDPSKLKFNSGETSYTIQKDSRFGTEFSPYQTVVNTKDYIDWESEKTFYVKGREDVDSAIKLLGFLSGRFSDVWYVREQTDFYMAQDSVVDTVAQKTTLRLRNAGFYQSYSPDREGSINLCIRVKPGGLHSGTHYVPITGMNFVQAGDLLELTFDTLLNGSTQPITVSEVSSISLIYKGRLSTDSVPVRWIGPDLAKVAVKFVRVFDKTTLLKQ